METMNFEKKDNNELHHKYLTPERATELAEETQKKIDFLKSIEDKVNNEESLTSEEEQEKKSLFGDKEFKKGLIGWGISGLESDHYQLATAGVNGAQSVEVAFPTYQNHKETEFETWMKEREINIKELYHYAGTTMDRATETIVSEYNKTAKPEEKIEWEDEVPHTCRWFSVSFVEEGQKKGLSFTFGRTVYNLTRHTDGNWYVVLEKEGLSFAPKSVNDKLKDLDRNIVFLLQDKANQILKY